MSTSNPSKTNPLFNGKGISELHVHGNATGITNLIGSGQMRAIPDDMTRSGKPPIGIMPRSIWIERRILELSSAINRHVNVQIFEPVHEWVDELQSLLKEVK